MSERSLSVVKFGGSVLTDLQAFRRAAAFVANQLKDEPGRQFVVVVSAEYGLTDALLACAQDFAAHPDPEALDLLWSTGEVRSVALLVLALHAAGVKATGLNVHQTGLLDRLGSSDDGPLTFQPLRLRSALARADVVVVPGFLARGPRDGITSLERGGSDLTAVLLAAGLGARTCQLIKDVRGYFSSDPKVDPQATPLDEISFDRATDLARAGSRLVQATALEAARKAGLPLLVRSIEGGAGTYVR